MDILGVLIVIGGALLIFRGFLWISTHFNKQRKKNEIHLPVSFIMIAFLVVAFFTLATVFSYRAGEMEASAFFIFFVVIGIVLIIAYLNCVITYDKETLTQKNFWGMRRTYRFCEITEVQYNADSIILFAGKKKIRVELMAPGSYEFLSLVWEHYRINNETLSAPPEKKSFLFKGKVKNPVTFIFIWVLMGVALIAISILLCAKVFPLQEQELIPIVAKCQRVEIKGENLYLYINGYEDPLEVIQYQKYMSGIKELLSDAPQKPLLHISMTNPHALKTKGSGDGTPAVIMQATEGHQYLTLEDTNKSRAESRPAVILFCAIVLMCYIAFFSLSIFVANHIERFPRLSKILSILKNVEQSIDI